MRALLARQIDAKARPRPSSAENRPAIDPSEPILAVSPNFDRATDRRQPNHSTPNSDPQVRQTARTSRMPDFESQDETPENVGIETVAAEIATDLVGGVSLPAPIKRNLFKALSRLCSAAVEIPIAYLEGKADERRAETEARVRLVHATASQIFEQMLAFYVEKYRSLVLTRLKLSKFLGKWIRNLQRTLRSFVPCARLLTMRMEMSLMHESYHWGAMRQPMLLQNMG